MAEFGTTYAQMKKDQAVNPCRPVTDTGGDAASSVKIAALGAASALSGAAAAADIGVNIASAIQEKKPLKAVGAVLVGVPSALVSGIPGASEVVYAAGRHAFGAIAGKDNMLVMGPGERAAVDLGCHVFGPNDEQKAAQKATEQKNEAANNELGSKLLKAKPDKKHPIIQPKKKGQKWTAGPGAAS